MKHPVTSKRSIIEQRLRNARGVADSGLSTDDVMRLTRGEKESVPGRFRNDLPDVKLVTPRDPAGDGGKD